MYKEINDPSCYLAKPVHVSISYTWYSDASKLNYSLYTTGQYIKHSQMLGELPVNPVISEWPQARKEKDGKKWN